jgi:DNA-binding NarL/FixJ family response regulator
MLRSTTYPPGCRTSAVPRVFLVDDNAPLRNALGDLLEDSGLQVVGQAGDGASALQLIPLAAATAPLVALVDVRMPGALNGIDLTHHLTTSALNVEVIVHTAFPDEGIRQAAKDAGALFFLVKGAIPDALIATVRDAWTALSIQH